MLLWVVLQGPGSVEARRASWAKMPQASLERVLSLLQQANEEKDYQVCAWEGGRDALGR
jgi:hypothetical protein